MDDVTFSPGELQTFARYENLVGAVAGAVFTAGCFILGGMAVSFYVKRKENRHKNNVVELVPPEK